MKLICAPMATLSHEAFRRAIEKFGGCDEYFTEMINAPSLVNMGPFEKYYLLNGPVPQKIVWQLTGTKADSLAQAAAIVAEQGGIGVDINMGCSAPQIYKTGAGIAWMLKPLAETREAVRAVRQALSEYETRTKNHLRMSVKCRLGADDFTESSFFAFTDMLAEEGVELVTLHPRTIKEKLRGTPRYEYVEKLALRYQDRMEIILNGEVRDAASARRAAKAAPHAKGIMIARAAAQKPWIFAELQSALCEETLQAETSRQAASHPETPQGTASRTVDCRQLALSFIDDVVQYQPQEFWKTRMQRFFAYYCQNFSFGHYFQTQMLNASSVEESRARIMDYFEKEPGDIMRFY